MGPITCFFVCVCLFIIFIAWCLLFLCMTIDERTVDNVVGIMKEVFDLVEQEKLWN